MNFSPSIAPESITKTLLASLLLGLLTTLAASSAESVPPLINYQGSLTDANGGPMAGVKSMEFNLYDAPTGGNRKWGPQVYATVPLIGGKFNVLLGPTDSGGTLITTAFADKTRYLSITIEGKEILPRQQILSTPFAMQAQEATHAKESDLAKEANHAAMADGTSDSKFEMPAGGTLYSPGLMHLSGEDTLHLLNKNGVHVNRAWGGNGNLTVDGMLRFGGGQGPFCIFSNACPNGWADRGQAGFLLMGDSPYPVGAGHSSYNWVHPRLCCN